MEQTECTFNSSRSVKAYAASLLAGNLFHVTFNGCSSFTLANRSGLFVELATTYFSQNTGFFAGTLETTQGYVKWLVFFNFYARHLSWTLLLLGLRRTFLPLHRGLKRVPRSGHSSHNFDEGAKFYIAGGWL
ncbi:hypothetical protein A8C75_04465 [Marinobacterium aestuarii]|uniref:Uncharacterized protein n=1 Tax=Marinobacterium aestuarii TaxID=1821621 RepID=A0A1A9EUH4_9GAMM|nr:hypothetical protein A8C75_04465 [Marinobacterium aestuarii]